MTRDKLRAPWLMVGLLLGCGEHRSSSTRSNLGFDDIARVGTAPVSRTVVTSIARERNVGITDALQATVEDNLLAAGARSRGVDREPGIRWAVAATLARQVPAHLLDAARREGAPRDDELGFRRVVHAVLMRSNNVATEDTGSMARALERAVSGASTAEDFIARARNVPHERVRIVAQYVGPFDAAGQTPQTATTEPGTIDPTFVAAAFHLRGSGSTSHLVETSFGWHVIRLVAEEPCPASDVDRRRRDLANDVVNLRARAALTDILRSRRERAQVRIEAGADTLQARVSVFQ